MMSGNTWARSPGRRLAIAAFLAAGAGLVLTGCNDTSNNGGDVTQIHSPKGTVIGSVVDNNGNMLAGVKVTIGNRTVTTNAGGQYQFDNVPVNNTITSDLSNEGGNTGQYITISIQPSATNVGATIVLNSQAQVVSAGQQPSSGSGLAVVASPQVTFVDGYLASAGTVELPALNATITGTLRNAVTGVPLSGVPLYAQFVSVVGTVPNNSGNGADARVITYATGSNTSNSGGSTAADGSFSFVGLPADSCFSVYSNLYNVSLSSNPVKTNGPQGSDVFTAVCGPSGDSGSQGIPANIANILVGTVNSPVGLNQIYASASPNGDTSRPFVTSVDNVLQQGSNPGQLTSSVTNKLVVHFSEAMLFAPTASNPLTVLVTSGVNTTVATVTSAVLDAAKTTLTITLGANLPAGAGVLVNLPRETVTDLAGNILTDDGEPVHFDSISNGSTTSFDVLNLATFKPGVTATGPFTVTQNFANQLTPSASFDFTQVLADVVGNANSKACLFGSTTCATTFAYNLPADAATVGLLNINQLNNLKTDAANNLNNVINGQNPIFFGGNPSVNPSVARVTVSLATPANFSDLVFQVTDALGNIKSVAYFPVNTSGGPNTAVATGPLLGNSSTKAAAANSPNSANSSAPGSISGTGNGWYKIAPNGATAFDVILVGYNGDTLKIGDVLHVVSRSTISGTPIVSEGVNLPLKDAIDPTAGLQILALTAGSTGSGSLGQGGVVYFDPSSGDPRLVIFPVTPQLADVNDALDLNGGGGYYRNNSFDQEIFAPSGLKTAGATDQGISGPDGPIQDSGDNYRADTDATGMAFYLGTTGASKNINAAITVTESVTATAALVNGYSGTAGLTAFNAVPLVNSKIFGSTGGPGPSQINDLVTFKLDDIFKLANDGHVLADEKAGKIIDLTGSITDQFGNVALAGDNAKLKVQDFFPPMMVSGYTDGAKYVFTFNEPIQLYGSLTFSGTTVPACAGGSVDLRVQSQLPTPTVSLDVTGKVLTVASSALVGNACFYPTTDTTHTYAESLYTTANTGVAVIPATLQHAFVSFNDVPDTVGNIWDAGNNNLIKAKKLKALPSNVKQDWASRRLGMGAPRFAFVSLVGPLSISSGFGGFQVGATSFTANITSNQGILNWLQNAVPAPAAPAIYGPALVPTLGVNPCAGTTYGATLACKTFIDGTLAITGPCAPAAGSTALFNGSNTAITYTIACSGAITAGNTATLMGTTNKFESNVTDPNNPTQNLSNTFNSAASLGTITAN